jgi:hypothetical protein
MKILDQYFIEKFGVNDYVEHRLHHWAKWYGQNNGSNLGYPSESLESRHLNSGGVIHSNGGIRPLPCNPAAEELEAVISILMQYDEKIAQALCQDYLYKKDQLKKAKGMGISAAQFKIDVAHARYWLRGWFHAQLMKKPL